jgi:hypothetical protein
MTKIIKPIQTFIDGGHVGTLVIDWEVKAFLDAPSNCHPDELETAAEEIHEVHQIHSIELQVFDKDGIDLTNRFTGNCLENLYSALLDDVDSEYFIERKGRDAA